MTTVQATTPMTTTAEAYAQVRDRFGTGTEISDGAARAIAALYASPGADSRDITAFCQGQPVPLGGLLWDIEHNRPHASTDADRMALAMLRTWAYVAASEAAVLDCGHPATSTAGLVGMGYASTPDGRRICYACADEVQRAHVASHDTVTAYVSADGQRVTTWSGGELMKVTGHDVSPRGAFGGRLDYWWAQSPDGRSWHGRNAGAGMFVTMRALKAASR